MATHHRLSVLVLLFLALLAAPSLADDIDTLEMRLEEAYLEGSSWNADTYFGSQLPDGSWDDINYDDRSRTSWDPVSHLSRLERMAIAYASEGNTYHHDSAMLDAIARGLAYWYARKPESDNWWYNDIGQQLELGPILIIMEDYLADSLIDTGAGYLNDPEATGQNLVWYATQTVQRGCLRESPADVNTGLDAIKNEVVITTGEGIQPDFSFHQHGPQLYNGGYGRGFLNDVSYWVHMSRGLSFGFSAAKIDILSGLILDGTQWMVRRGNLDFACQGREISRPNNGRASSFGTALTRMADLGTARQAELQAFNDHVQGDNDSALTGDRHFWRADYHAHRRPGYHASVKMCSDRTTGTEFMNNENRQGYYLPFGATVFLRTGDEYYNVYPIWDWAHVPGVTCPDKNPPPQMTTYIRGTTGFVGGASDGTHGVAGMALDWDGVTAKKAWFLFDEEIVALGAGITSDNAEAVHTSINQSWLRGTVRVAEDGAAGVAVSPGSHALSAVSWVHHDSVGYVFAGTSDLSLSNSVQSGSWNDINNTYSSDAITDSVFTMWIDHGVRPSDAAYEYIVVPGIDQSAMQAYADAVPVRTVANNTGIQAVRHDGLQVSGVVFHESGQVALHAGLSVTVDQPCMLVVDESSTGVAVTASNPRHAALSLAVDLTGDVSGQLLFSLPGGDSAGSSVTLSLGSSTRSARPAALVPDGAIRVSRTPQGALLHVTVDSDGPLGAWLVRTDGRQSRLQARRQSGRGQHTVEVSGVAPGVYVLRLATAAGSMVRRVRL